MLYEILLKLGLDLCVPILHRTVLFHDIYAVGGGVLFACLSEAISTNDIELLGHEIVTWRNELNPAGELTCIFRDNAFSDDVSKVNMMTILEQSGIKNVRSL